MSERKCIFCGNELTSWTQKFFCSKFCAVHYRIKKKREEQEQSKVQHCQEQQQSALGPRKCHDCGAITTDYRCPSCLRECRRENGITYEIISDGEG